MSEVDAEGRLVAFVNFDPDDRHAASAELFERYVRSDAGAWMAPGVVELRRSLLARDLDRIRAAIPDDYVLHDHRRVGAGRVEGADANVAWFAALFEQSPDAMVETIYYVATGKHGFVGVGRTFGTNVEGGEFESVFVQLLHQRGERPVSTELFELDHLDVARARFEELRPDPLRIPPNAASRVRDRMFETLTVRDWPAARALASPDFTFEDRRRRSLLTGDLELYLKNAEFMVSQPFARTTRERIGSAGDRIVLERCVFRVGPAGGEVEPERILLAEVDAEGRLVALINWDVDDRRAAFIEARDRFIVGEAAGVAAPARIMSFDRAALRGDWEATRECFADDVTFRDHRVLGLGLADRNGLVELIRVIADLAPDRWVEWLRILTWNDRGMVALLREAGTVPGGGPFENVFVGLAVTDGDRIRYLELFAVDDTDRALARFEELCADRSWERSA